MPYTFVPKEKHAKAYSTLQISEKVAKKMCRVISKKKLSVVMRLLLDLESRKRDMDGKYYTAAIPPLRMLIQSAAKNAEALGIDRDKLFVYASSCVAGNLRRGRRRSDFGHRMKVTNVGIILVEKGKGFDAKTTKKPAKAETVKKEVAMKTEAHKAEAPKKEKVAKTPRVKAEEKKE